MLKVFNPIHGASEVAKGSMCYQPYYTEKFSGPSTGLYLCPDPEKELNEYLLKKWNSEHLATKKHHVTDHLLGMWLDNSTLGLKSLLTKALLGKSTLLCSL